MNIFSTYTNSLVQIYYGTWGGHLKSPIGRKYTSLVMYSPTENIHDPSFESILSKSEIQDGHHSRTLQFNIVANGKKIKFPRHRIV